MQTTHVGVRDAKIHLSRFLQIVKNGGEVVITQRGKPVGKLIPYESSELSLSQRLRNLETKGWVKPIIQKQKDRIPSPIPLPDDLAQQYLQEDRRHDG
jgi:prevent-host-death family protein